MKWRDFWRRWFTQPEQQTTFCYCPGCGLELCGSEDVGIGWADDRFVMYYCACQTRSAWDFDAPVPLLMRSGKGVGFRLHAQSMRRQEVRK